MFIHLQEGICGNTNKKAKNVQENKEQIPFYTSPKEEADNQAKQGPNARRTRINPN